MHVSRRVDRRTSTILNDPELGDLHGDDADVGGLPEAPVAEEAGEAEPEVIRGASARRERPRRRSGRRLGWRKLPCAKLSLCLGNPGPEYSATRHNVGWWLADRLAERCGLGRFQQQGNGGGGDGAASTGVAVQVVKPLTYMNRSGAALDGALDARGPSSLAATCSWWWTRWRSSPGARGFAPGGSAGGHNGLKSVEAALGTQEYRAAAHRRRRERRPARDLADWVLSSPPPADRAGDHRACSPRWSMRRRLDDGRHRGGDEPLQPLNACDSDGRALDAPPIVTHPKRERTT